jgi:hypothetical protein
VTNGEIITLARHIIQDSVEPYRHTTEKLLAYLSDGLAVIRRYRPDLYIGELADPVPAYMSESELDQSPPISSEYHSALAHYIVALVQATEDEASHLERLSSLLTHFLQLLRAR